MPDRPAFPSRAPARDVRRAARAAGAFALALATACERDPVRPSAPGSAARWVAVADSGAALARGANCGNYTTTWIRTGSPYNNEMVHGQIIWFTGIVLPGTTAAFTVRDEQGNVRMTHVTQRARSNCVIHHEPEARTTYELTPGVYNVYSSFYLPVNRYAWQYVADRHVQTITVREAPPPPPDPVEPVEPCFFRGAPAPTAAARAARINPCY